MDYMSVRHCPNGMEALHCPTGRVARASAANTVGSSSGGAPSAPPNASTESTSSS